MQLINGMIRTRRLFEFVNKLLDMHNEEFLWDVWIHRVFDKSYKEFVGALEENKKAAPTQKETASIVSESHGILNNFKPVE